MYEYKFYTGRYLFYTDNWRLGLFLMVGLILFIIGASFHARFFSGESSKVLEAKTKDKKITATEMAFIFFFILILVINCIYIIRIW